MMHWGQYKFQDANSSIMEELIFLHDYINMILIFILSFVSLIMFLMFLNKYSNKSLMESQTIEFIWTLVPMIILSQIAMPSLILLYLLDESSETSLTIKALGHQWYWSYEYTDFWNNKNSGCGEYDSYMVPSDELESGMFRLLEVDNRVIAPFGTSIRVLVSSGDVLHSWTVPSLGVKVDAVPGRLNQLKFLARRPGLFFGQCSEICGANHSFMPIAMEIVSPSSFMGWVSTLDM